jgi:tetratricopeptide (TPR) repeat protein
MTEKPYPYDVVAPFGIHPNSTALTVQNVNPALLDRKAGTVWHSLRSVDNRLEADFFLNEIRDRTRLGQFISGIAYGKRTCAEKDFQRALGEDAAIVLLFLGRREEAVRLLESQQRDRLDVATAHRLALISYAAAQQYEEDRTMDPNYGLATDAWRRTVANWTVALVNDEYWNHWCDRRQHIYGQTKGGRLSASHRQEVRERLRRRLAAEFAQYAEWHREAGREDRSQFHREMELRYEVEWRAATTCKAAGGMTLEGGTTFIAGPLLLQHMTLGGKLGELVSKVQHELDEYLAQDDLERLRASDPKVSPENADSLRMYFSELGPPKALLELNRPHEALPRVRGLESFAHLAESSAVYTALKNGENRFRRDAAALEIDSHLAIAETAITIARPDLALARSAWSESCKVAIRISAGEDVALRIGKQATGRARALVDEGEDKRASLVQSIALLDAARDLVRASDDARLDLTLCLAEQLCIRARRRVKDDRYEEAYRDMRRALSLYPDNVEIVDEFCQCLVCWGMDLAGTDPAQALALLTRARKMAESTLQRQENESLRDTLQWTCGRIEILNGRSPNPRLWEDLMRLTGPPALAHDPDRQRAHQHRVNADEKRADGDFEGAIDELTKAFALLPDYPDAKELLSVIHQQWAAALLNDGEIGRAANAVRNALAAGCDPEAFERLKKRIEYSGGSLGGPVTEARC